MDAQTLRNCADHIADTISKSIDSIGPIELGPDTQTAIIASNIAAMTNMHHLQLDEDLIKKIVEVARDIQKEIRRRR